MKTPTPTLGRLLGEWQLDPAVLGVCATAALLYGYGAIRSRRAWPLGRSVAFLAGLGVLVTALLSGIDSYSEKLLSLHVIQHLLLILLAPALLLWGAPVRLALSSSSPAARTRIGRLLRRPSARLVTRPAFGFALFTAAVLATHLTGVYELALRNATAHSFEHAAYFWCGIVFLLPLVAADPVPHPPGAIVRFSWLMGAMTVMALPAALFIFDEHVRYPFYLAPARALHRSALADQHTAGMVMLFAGGTAMALLAIVVSMEAMVREERRQLRRDAYLYPEDAQPRAGEPADVAEELAGA